LPNSLLLLLLEAKFSPFQWLSFYWRLKTAVYYL
jgi:hypothetical protein